MAIQIVQMMITVDFRRFILDFPPQKKHIGDFPATFDYPGFLKASAMPSRMREVPGVAGPRATAFGYTLENSQSLTPSLYFRWFVSVVKKTHFLPW